MNGSIRKVYIGAIVLLLGVFAISLNIYTAIGGKASGNVVEVQLPVQGTENTVTVPENAVLVLGAEGKYIFRNDDETPVEIPAGDWDTPVGYYDAQTKVVIGNKAFVRSVVPATIQQITGDESSDLWIVEGSRITINTGEEVGVRAGTLSVSSPDTVASTELKVSAGGAAIHYFTRLDVYPKSLLEATGVHYGIFQDSNLFAGAILQAYPASKITANATGAGGIAIKGENMYVTACEITADAPQGSGGIQLSSMLDIMAENVDGTAVGSVVNASSYNGRAIGVGYGEMSGSIQVVGSVLRGVTQHGQAGVYASYISATVFHEPYLPSEIFGSADVGFGIVAQILDSDSEFPSGGLSITDSKVVGHVNEGMGISSFMFSSYPSGVENASRTLIEGIAQKGIGISVCSGYIHNADIIGKSYGSTQKHFQVYDSIADSAGINFLSYLHIFDDATVLAEAPPEDPNSFGLHGLLNSADGTYRSGEIYASASEQGLSITAEGGTGISVGAGVNLYSGDGQKVDVTAHGSVNGIEATRLSASSSSAAEPLIRIDAVGDRGVGLTSTPILEGNYYAFNLDGTSLRAVGEQYGVRFQLDEDINIINSKINATATGNTTAATGFFIEHLANDQYPASLFLSDSIINTAGRQHGWHSKNMNISISKDTPFFDTGDIFTARGGEIGLLVEFDKNIDPDGILGLQISNNSGVGNAVVTAVSDSVPPDQIGRRPAVSAPHIQLIDTVVLLENYLQPISEFISNTPYMAYAKDQNINDITNYNWNGSSIPIEVSAEGLWTTEPDSFGQTVIGKRTGPLTGEIVDIVSAGEHQVKMVTGAEEYTITYDANGASGIPPASAAYPAETSVTVAGPGALALVDHSFAGWKDDSGNSYAPGSTFIITRDVTLYAQWAYTPIESPKTGSSGPRILFIVWGGLILNSLLLIWTRIKNRAVPK